MIENEVTTFSPPTIDLIHYGNKIADFFVSYSPGFFNDSRSVLGFLIGISIPISLFLFIGIIYVVDGLKRCRRREEIIYGPPEIPVVKEEKGDPALVKKWQKILDHVGSKNENDWRQAIIEADIILDDLLSKLGYQGETIGERLKRVDKGDFKTLSQANEAHWVRNRIAHDGSDHPLNQLEAQRVINLYKQVFEEFYHI